MDPSALKSLLETFFVREGALDRCLGAIYRYVYEFEAGPKY